MRFLSAFIACTLIPGCLPAKKSGPEAAPATAEDFLARASVFLEASKYSEALALADSARAYANSENWDQINVESELNAAEIEIRKAEYPAARTRLDGILSRHLNSPIEDSSRARALLLIARSSIRTGRYREAESQLNESLKLLRDIYGSDAPAIGTVLHYAGLTQHESGNLQTALELYEQALETRIRTKGRYSREVAATYNNIGNVYWRLGEYSKALDTHNATLAIKTEMLDPDDPELGISMANLGNLHAITGDSAKAEFYYRSALSIYSLSEGNKLFRAKTEDNLGSLLTGFGKLAEASALLESSHQVFLEVLGPNHGTVGVSLVHLGALNFARGNPESGAELFGKGVELMIESHRPDAAHEMLAFSRLLMATQQVAYADSLLERASIFISEAFGPRSPIALSLENDRIERLLQERAFGQAMRVAQATIRRNLRNESPIIDSQSARERAVSLTELLRSYDLWSQAVVHQLTAGVLSVFDADDVLLTYGRAAAVFSSLRTEFLYSQQPGSVREQYERILKDAFRVSLQFYRSTHSQRYLNDAFRFSEHTHSGSLQDALSHSKARTFARIPDSLVSLEKQYRDQLLKIERFRAIWLLENPESQTESQTLNFLRYAYEDSLSRLIDLYDVGFPKYHAMRYSRRTAPIAEMERVLGPGRDLIEYTMAGDSVYAIVLGPDTQAIFGLESIAEVDRSVNQYLSAVQNRDEVAAAELGYSLYQRVVQPIVGTATSSSWLIVPDGSLLNLPFETLLSRGPETWVEGPLPYLIREKTISYSYSATLFADSAPLDEEMAKRGSAFIAAPSFAGGIDISSDLLGLEDQPGRTHFDELRGTSKEAVAIDRLFDRHMRRKAGPVTVKTGADVTESYLKRASLTGYDFVHFATHGYTNAETPSLSGLIIDEGIDGEDGVLHVGEVLGLSLNADMVVLSACRTGVQTNTAGQGLMGLSRAFLYSGARSVVASLWNASDEYATMTMSYFYQNLLTGLDRGEALRQAKISVMESSPEAERRPGLWGSFVLIGA